MSGDVAWLADWVQIRHLTARYNRASDDLDIDALVETFTPDGVIEAPGSNPIVGHEGLRASLSRVPYGTVHVTCDPVIEIDGDHATQECTLIMCRRRADKAAVDVITTGRYRDELLRCPQGWRFQRRTISADLEPRTMMEAFWSSEDREA